MSEGRGVKVGAAGWKRERGKVEAAWRERWEGERRVL